MIRLVAFDADDTLWQNETEYIKTKEKYKKLLSSYSRPELTEEKLFEMEMQNLSTWGYGIKAFTISMIEAAIELSGGKITALEIEKIIGYSREMLNARLPLLPHARETVAELSQSYDLMIITKGDLFEQENKIIRSGLNSFFKYMEVLSEKTAQSYSDVLDKYDIQPSGFLMVGNSLRSDILPVIEIGAIAVYIPHPLTWAHENSVDGSVSNRDGYFEIKHLGELPELIKKLEGEC